MTQDIRRRAHSHPGGHSEAEWNKIVGQLGERAALKITDLSDKHEWGFEVFAAVYELVATAYADGIAAARSGRAVTVEVPGSGSAYVRDDPPAFLAAAVKAVGPFHELLSRTIVAAGYTHSTAEVLADAIERAIESRDWRR